MRGLKSAPWAAIGALLTVLALLGSCLAADSEDDKSHEQLAGTSTTLSRQDDEILKRLDLIELELANTRAELEALKAKLAQSSQPSSSSGGPIDAEPHRLSDTISLAIDDEEFARRVKLISKKYRKMDTNNNLKQRCHRYYLIFTFPGRLLEPDIFRLLKFHIADVWPGVPAESYYQKVAPNLVGDLEEIARALLASSKMAANKVGEDMLRCVGSRSQQAREAEAVTDEAQSGH